MSTVCQICGKGTSSGSRIVRHGLAKKKGGIGLHTTGISKRIFKANLQKMRAQGGRRREDNDGVHVLHQGGQNRQGLRLRGTARPSGIGIARLPGKHPAALARRGVFASVGHIMKTERSP